MTVPATLLIVPLLKSVVAPFWLNRLSSVTVVTVASGLVKRKSNWAPAIGVAGVIGLVRVNGVLGVT